jgi:hypothetical protein
MDNQQNESSVAQLIADAAQAEELLDSDDLERFAAAQAAAVQTRQVRKKDDVTMEGPCCICGKPLTKGTGYFAVMEVKDGRYAHPHCSHGGRLIQLVRCPEPHSTKSEGISS